MQHPDEGMIHSWLDGALSADEAARLEAHVKECPECAAAVAEARGFIAGASRILTALDNAPRGVIPAAAPKKRIDPWILRVAATVLVVAAGTLMVVRNTSNSPDAGFTISEEPDSAPISKPLPPVSVQADPSRIAALGRSQTSAGSTKESAAKVAPSNAPHALGITTDAPEVSSRIATPERKEALKRRSTMQSPQDLVPSGYAQAGASTDSTAGSGRVASSFLARDMGQSEPLKVVGTPRRIGAKVTLYEVAPGDTVTLTEVIQVAVSNVLATGSAVAPAIAQRTNNSVRSTEAQSKARADAAAIAKMSDSSGAAGAPPTTSPIPAPAFSSQAASANALHAITWTDSATKNTLTLTGRMTEARLQEIKTRIERERAAAAAAKRSP